MKNETKKTSAIISAGLNNLMQEMVFLVIRNCLGCPLLDEKNANGYYIYTAINDKMADTYNVPMLAFGEYKIDDEIVIYPVCFPAYFDYSQRKKVFKEWINTLEDREIVLVFSINDYNIAKECLENRDCNTIILSERT